MSCPRQDVLVQAKALIDSWRKDSGGNVSAEADELEALLFPATYEAARAPRRPRSVKVEDDLWDAAKAKADQRGEILSEQIREFLKRYARR